IDAPGEHGEPLAQRLAAISQAPLDAAVLSERAESVREAVSRLTPTTRDALVLFYFQGLAYDEIAHALEVPLGTVKSRIHNALSKLAALLAPAARDPEARHA